MSQFSNDSATTQAGASKPLFDPLILNTFRVINLATLAEVVGVFGIVSNVVNIRVFRHLGYRDGVNVTLTALAVSDIGVLVVQQLYNVLVWPFIGEYEFPVNKSHVQSMMHYVITYFVRVSSVITTFASVERCLCIVLPLRVKTVITRNLAVAVNATFFVVLSMYMFPPYYSIYFDYKHVPGLNRSVMFIFYKSYGEGVLKISYNITDLVLPYSTFLVLILCSIVMYVKLKSKARWRQSVSSSGSLMTSSTSTSVKEIKTGVMLMTVSLVCVSFLLPETMVITATGFVRELKSGGSLKDISTLAISFTILLETVNCSITIFIYYKMSSKYRAVFCKMFPYFGRWKQ